MKLDDLRQKMTGNLFTLSDVKKYFSEEKERDLVTQLYRFKTRGKLESVKRGLYSFDLAQVDEFEVANKIYSGSSYVSLESALHYYGMIPDITAQIVSVTSGAPKEFNISIGWFVYHRIKPELFWGYKKIAGASGNYFLIAEREKAMLDFFYIRKIRKITDLRLNLAEFDMSLYTKYSNYYPGWVRKIDIKT